jgi:hypothetical protein
LAFGQTPSEATQDYDDYYLHRAGGYAMADDRSTQWKDTSVGRYYQGAKRGYQAAKPYVQRAAQRLADDFRGNAEDLRITYDRAKKALRPKSRSRSR